MKEQVEFLSQLYEQLVDTFGQDLGVALLGAAAAELFAGPKGVTAMFVQAQQFTSKPIPK